MLLIAIACSAGRQDTAVHEEEEPPPSFSLEQAFYVHDRPYDLAQHPDGRIFSSAQAGGRVYTWMPGDELSEELEQDFGNVQGIAFIGERLYFTTSDFGVTGTVSVLGDGGTEVLATQSADGTLLRWPADMVPDGDGGLWIADFEAGALFHMGADGGLSLHGAGSSAPEALAIRDGSVFIGGEDGIWVKDGLGLPEKLYDTPAIGLELADGELWAVHPSAGLFRPGHGAAPLSGTNRPASILRAENGFYIADRVGQWVWKALVDTE